MSAEPTTNPGIEDDWPSWRRLPSRRGSVPVRTTLPIESAYLGAIDREVAAGRARSRADFIDRAIRNELRRREEAAVDAEFIAAAGDPQLEELDRQLMAEFAGTDREAWASLDREHGPYNAAR